MSSFTPLSRRHLLRGAGAALSLPLLESMLPRSWGAPSTFEPQRLSETVQPRMVCCYVPNGVNILDWMPADSGDRYTLSPTLAALADAGVLSGETAAVAEAFGIGAAASTPPLIPWATGLDLGGVPRGEALRQAARVARARAARRDGEARQFGRIVVALVIAGLAVLAYALVLFLPAIDFFMAISEASASR